MISKNIIVFTALIVMTTCVAIAATVDNQIDISLDNVPVELVSNADDIDIVVDDDDGKLYSLSRENSGDELDSKHVKIWIE